jgi:predicted nucleotidyltransferase
MLVDPKIIGLVQEHLIRIKRESQVRILYAGESGSRAWGFPSPDSDFDVRFIYAHDKDWYLSLAEESDVIEKNLEGDLDVVGWDIRKTLRLILKSNSVPFEWLQSPIVYVQQVGFVESIMKAAGPYFSMKTGFHHYLSLCKRVIEETKGDSQFIKSKKYFYILRPLLAAAWIYDHKVVPPMKFQDLCETPRIDQRLRIEIDKLLEIKLQSNEKKEISRSVALDDFIVKTITDIEESSLALPPAQRDTKTLDKFFKELLL